MTHIWNTDKKEKGQEMLGEENTRITPKEKHNRMDGRGEGNQQIKELIRKCYW
jgi:hypothetical protein